jgi:ELWxxDGT repeat protein
MRQFSAGSLNQTKRRSASKLNQFRSRHRLTIEQLERRQLLAVDIDLINDINTVNDVDGGPSGEFVQVGSIAYFRGYSPVQGLELWKTNGTAAGTSIVRDINVGHENSIPSGITNVNGTAYFTAITKANGRELWKSDGTSSGTTLVKDIYPGDDQSGIGNIVSIGSTVYFTAFNGNFNALYNTKTKAYCLWANEAPAETGRTRLLPR